MKIPVIVLVDLEMFVHAVFDRQTELRGPSLPDLTLPRRPDVRYVDLYATTGPHNARAFVEPGIVEMLGPPLGPRSYRLLFRYHSNYSFSEGSDYRATPAKLRQRSNPHQTKSGIGTSRGIACRLCPRKQNRVPVGYPTIPQGPLL